MDVRPLNQSGFLTLQRWLKGLIASGTCILSLGYLFDLRLAVELVANAALPSEGNGASDFRGLSSKPLCVLKMLLGNKQKLAALLTDEPAYSFANLVISLLLISRSMEIELLVACMVSKSGSHQERLHPQSCNHITIADPFYYQCQPLR